MIPFREKGVPAVLQIEDKTGDFNPQYHRQGDTLANMTLGYWQDHIRALTAAAAVLAEPVPLVLPSPTVPASGTPSLPATTATSPPASSTATSTSPPASATARLTEEPTSAASRTPSTTHEPTTAIATPSMTQAPTTTRGAPTARATPTDVRLLLPVLLRRE